MTEYECKLCSVTFDTRKELQDHMREAHGLEDDEIEEEIEVHD
ncbi:C2H2-type zinc finger protein [Halorutilales archaeon Cl-col2-1]